MKTLLKIIVGFGIIMNINAQSIERISFKISKKEKSQSALNFNQKLKVIDGLNIALTPQFGNLFITRLEAKKAKINLKDYYNDFDLGVNLGLCWNIKKNMNFKTLYNMGLLKFNKPDIEKAESYVVQLAIDYVF